MSLVNTNEQFVTCNTVTGTAGAAATLTLASVAGKRHAITGLQIYRAAAGAVAGSAVLGITTTNLPGSLGWTVGNAMAAGGTQIDVDMTFDPPLLASAATTATTFVMADPDAGSAVTWNARAFYFLVPEV